MLSFFLFILGLIVGSFLGSFTYRFPKGITIKKGRSFCPICGATIHWFDNVPLLSYAFLKGRCRNCKEKISIRYPLIELATAIVFVLIGPNPFLLFTSSLLIAIFIIDWEHMIIPDDFVFVGLLVTFFYLVLVVSSSTFYSNLLAGLVSSLLLLAIYFVTKGAGMGLGDVKLAVLIGMVLGIRMSLVWLTTSFVAGGIVAAILLLTNRAKLKQEIAFGPFLVFGYFVTIFFGDKLIFF